jgi:5'-nucleotidase (lipoprotein e(P4) family)
MKRALFLFLALSLIGYSDSKEHQSLMATLFAQSSAEAYANSQTIYKSAQDNLDELIADKNHTAALEQTGKYQNKPPAIILDVDQTVLDNIAYQARLIRNGTSYPDGWIEWAKEEQAEFMPGAKEFMEYALSKGVEVFFVTNRVLEIEQATINNFDKLGFRLSSKLDLILSKGENGWGSNKTSRRELIAKDYRILMMFGDNFGDFVDIEENLLPPKDRVNIAKKYKDYWGTSWYMFANPTYGAWEGALINFDYSLSKDQQLKLKDSALDTK